MADEVEKKPEFVIHHKRQASTDKAPASPAEKKQKRVIIVKRAPKAADGAKTEKVRVVAKQDRKTAAAQKIFQTEVVPPTARPLRVRKREDSAPVRIATARALPERRHAPGIKTENAKISRAVIRREGAAVPDFRVPVRAFRAEALVPVSKTVVRDSAERGPADSVLPLQFRLRRDLQKNRLKAKNRFTAKPTNSSKTINFLRKRKKPKRLRTSFRNRSISWNRFPFPISLVK